MEITIFTNEVAGGWHPDDVDRFLTANEETLVLWSEALVRAGHAPTVYASLRGCSACERKGVHYAARGAFDPLGRFAALITYKSRLPWQQGADAPVRLHWSMDIEPPWSSGTLARVQRFLALAPYHASRMPWVPAAKAGQVPLGMDLRDTDKARRPAGIAAANLAVYTTSPDRGLERLLLDWPAIAAAHPGLKLLVTYDVGRLGGSPLGAWLVARAREVGAEFTGPLPKAEFNALVARARYNVHPLNRFDSDLFGYGAYRAWRLGALPVLNYYHGTAFADTVPVWAPYREFLTGAAVVRQETPPITVLSWDDNVKQYWEPLLAGQAREVAA